MIDNYQGVQNNLQSKSFIYTHSFFGGKTPKVYVSGKTREEPRSAALQADSPFELPGKPNTRALSVNTQKIGTKSSHLKDGIKNTSLS